MEFGKLLLNICGRENLHSVKYVDWTLIDVNRLQRQILPCNYQLIGAGVDSLKGISFEIN